MSKQSTENEYVMPFNKIKVKKDEEDIMLCRICDKSFIDLEAYTKHAMTEVHACMHTLKENEGQTHVNYYDIVPNVKIEIEENEPFKNRDDNLSNVQVKNVIIVTNRDVHDMVLNAEDRLQLKRKGIEDGDIEVRAVKNAIKMERKTLDELECESKSAILGGHTSPGYAGKDTYPAKKLKKEREDKKEVNTAATREDKKEVHSTLKQTQISVTKTIFKNDAFELNLENQTIKIPTILNDIHSKIFVCDACREQFYSKAMLRQHISKHVTKLSSVRLRNLEIHGMEKMNGSQSDNTCSKSSEKNLLKQLSDKSFSCPICKYKSDSKVNLRIHFKTHINNSKSKNSSDNPSDENLINNLRNKSISWSIREHKSDSKVDFRIHFKTHLNNYNDSFNGNLVNKLSNNSNSCPVCDYKSGSKSNLRMHLKSHDRKRFFCNTCNYKCISNSELQRHIRSHTGEKLLVCHICGRKFNHSGVLNRHFRTHSTDKLFICSYCDYKCNRNDSLQSHMKTHSNLLSISESHQSKCYICDFCDFKCKIKGVLTRHIRKHTGEKPFACIICDYKCSRNYSLKFHMKRHTKEKPFVCDICDYKCNRKDYLRSHIKKHTNKRFSGKII